MLLAAATSHGPSVLTSVLGLCFCAWALAFGVAHYRGWHRAWIRFFPFDAHFFAPAWFGACGLLIFLGELAARFSTVLGVLIALPAVVPFVIMLMSLFWLPDRLLPAWYLDWRAHGRPAGGLAG